MFHNQSKTHYILFKYIFQIQVTGGLFDIYRSDKPAFPERDEREFSAALRYDFYYTIQFVDNVPPVIIFTGRSISE